MLSVEGCELIGQGANGKVYRTDRETIIKVYKNPDALLEIHRERELARLAFVAGVPTAIPYDVVRIEGSGEAESGTAEAGDSKRATYGSVFELLNAKNFARLLIDMDTLCHGHPIFELASMYNAYVSFGLIDPEVQMAFMGLSHDTCGQFWRRSLEYYLGTRDAAIFDDVEEKAKIIGLTRLMRREIRRDGLNREDGRKLIEACRAELVGLLPRVESLTF